MEGRSALDTLYLLFGTALVFLMQAGFALLEAGSVRAKNTKNILLKNTLDACLGAILWWACGYAFAFEKGGEFIGGKDYDAYFLANTDSNTADAEPYIWWLFQWAFAAAAATIVSGAVAERCNFAAYLVYTTVITGFIYPVVVHWGWSGEGWFSTEFGDNGFVDFAGSGIVHMVGGAAALMGAIFLGPRYGRFREDTGEIVDMPGHSTVLAALGTFILWFGWYGFNPVSTLAFGGMAVAEKAAVTTTIAAAAGGVTTLATSVAMGNPLDVGPALNGILAGLVSITASCSVVEPYAAAIIGVIGGLVYYGSSKMLLMMKIDDPLDASPVHFFCGAWGVISCGLFATQYNLAAAFGINNDEYGLFYGGGGKQLGIQLVGVVTFAAWTCSTSGLMFFVLKTIGMLRVPESEELAGLDESHHGGGAYDFSKPGQY